RCRYFFAIVLVKLTVYCFFFFYCCSHLRVLHSFPTRRSSDLCLRSASRIATSSSLAVWRCGYENSKCGGREGEVQCLLAERTERSEEHTSELQSRFDLVCRLLLEKKKLLDVLPENHSPQVQRL